MRFLLVSLTDWVKITVDGEVGEKERRTGYEQDFVSHKQIKF